MSLIDKLQPWVMLAVGLSLTVSGVRMLRRPKLYVGTGLVPASDPRTVRIFGSASLLMGLLSISLHLPRLFSE